MLRVLFTVVAVIENVVQGRKLEPECAGGEHGGNGDVEVGGVGLLRGYGGGGGGGGDGDGYEYDDGDDFDDARTSGDDYDDDAEVST